MCRRAGSVSPACRRSRRRFAMPSSPRPAAASGGCRSAARYRPRLPRYHPDDCHSATGRRHRQPCRELGSQPRNGSRHLEARFSQWRCDGCRISRASRNRVELGARWWLQPVRPLPGEDYPYPPMRTGMRGSQPGSFIAAHALRDSRSVDLPRAEHTGETYDLIIVGGGLSGLAAAHFFHKSIGPGARVLILDNHDDVGGHARRNEFHYQGRTLALNGGTFDIESPARYNQWARQVLDDIGVDLPRYVAANKANAGLYGSLGLRSGYFFEREKFGADRLVVAPASDGRPVAAALHGGLPAPHAAFRARAAGSAAAAGPEAARLSRGSRAGAEDGAPRPHQLQGLSAPGRQGRQPGVLVLHGARPRCIRCRRRCDARALRLGDGRRRLCGSAVGAAPRWAPGRSAGRTAWPPAAGRGRRALPGRQCDARASAGASADP